MTTVRVNGVMISFDENVSTRDKQVIVNGKETGIFISEPRAQIVQINSVVQTYHREPGFGADWDI